MDHSKLLEGFEDIYENLYENEYSADPDEEAECLVGEAMALVDKLPEEVLKDTAVKAVLMDEGLMNFLSLKYDFKMDERLIKRLKREIRSVILDHINEEFCVEWDEAERLFDDFDRFLSDKIPALLEQGCALEAFQLIAFLLTEVGTTEIEYDADDAECFAEDAAVEWFKAAEGLKEEELPEARAVLEGIDLDDFCNPEIEKIIVEFSNEFFATEEYMLERIAVLDRILEANKGERDVRVSDFPAFGSVDAAIQRIGYMQKLHMPEEEIARFRKEHRYLRVLHDLEYSEAIQNEDYDRAIALLKEAKLLDKDKEFIVEWYSDLLLSLYKKLGRTEDYEAELVFRRNTLGIDDLEDEE